MLICCRNTQTWRPSVELVKSPETSLQVANKSGPGPGIRIVALVPVDADAVSTGLGRWYRYGVGDSTYNVLRPAMRGWVAQEPPRTILCFPSKKSAKNPSAWGSSTKFTHNHTCICRIQFHGLEAFIPVKWRTGPFPDTTHISLTSKFVTMCSNGNWVPMLETNIGVFEIGEELLRALARLRSQ